MLLLVKSAIKIDKGIMNETYFKWISMISHIRRESDQV